ncbi:MAG: 2-oxo acid dehydrogenase subunit E2, partial [Gemmatimonadota bacterium]
RLRPVGAAPEPRPTPPQQTAPPHQRRDVVDAAPVRLAAAAVEQVDAELAVVEPPPRQRLLPPIRQPPSRQ